MDLSLIIGLVSVLWVATEIALARLKRSAASDARLDRSSFVLIWAVILLCIPTAVFVTARGVGAITAAGRILPLIGLCLILLGLLLRWSAILTLRRYFTIDVSIRSGHRLIRTGLYRHVRHPSYSGSLISFLGLGVAFSNWIAFVVIVIPVATVFLYRISVEENALASHFGAEYDAYRNSTKRLIPKVY